MANGLGLFSCGGSSLIPTVAGTVTSESPGTGGPCCPAWEEETPPRNRRGREDVNILHVLFPLAAAQQRRPSSRGKERRQLGVERSQRFGSKMQRSCCKLGSGSGAGSESQPLPIRHFPGCYSGPGPSAWVPGPCGLERGRRLGLGGPSKGMQLLLTVPLIRQPPQQGRGPGRGLSLGKEFRKWLPRRVGAAAGRGDQ